MSKLITYCQIKAELSSVGELRFGTPCVAKFNEKLTLSAISTLLSKTFFKIGYTPKEDYQQQHELLVQSLYETIQRSYDWITFTELELAFDRGYRNVYGDFMGWNLKTFCQWMDGFYVNDRKKEMDKNKPKVEEPKALTQEEKDAKVEKGVIRLQEQFKSLGRVPEGNLYIYTYLRNKGRIKRLEGIQREVIIKKAERKIQSELKKVRRRDRPNKARQQRMIENECKKLHLEQYLEQLKPTT